jgi:hypothetical protein
MPTENTWQQWLERLYNLRRDKRGSHERPHKPVLLLAVLDLLDRGSLTKNGSGTMTLTGTTRKVMIVATEGSASSQPTAVTLLTGVEPILTAAPEGNRAAMLLSPWNLGGADAGGGNQ